MVMAKIRPTAENTLCQWYCLLINHISESMKKVESNVKQKVTWLFKSKVDNKKPTGYRPKKINNASFEEDMLKNHHWQNTLKKLGLTYLI